MSVHNYALQINLKLWIFSFELSSYLTLSALPCSSKFSTHLCARFARLCAHIVVSPTFDRGVWNNNLSLPVFAIRHRNTTLILSVEYLPTGTLGGTRLACVSPFYSLSLSTNDKRFLGVKKKVKNISYPFEPVVCELFVHNTTGCELSRCPPAYSNVGSTVRYCTYHRCASPDAFADKKVKPTITERLDNEPSLHAHKVINKIKTLETMMRSYKRQTIFLRLTLNTADFS